MVPIPVFMTLLQPDVLEGGEGWRPASTVPTLPHSPSGAGRTRGVLTPSGGGRTGGSPPLPVSAVSIGMVHRDGRDPRRTTSSRRRGPQLAGIRDLGGP